MIPPAKIFKPLNFEDFNNIEIFVPKYNFIKPYYIELFITDYGEHTPSYIYRLFSEYYSKDSKIEI